MGTATVYVASGEVAGTGKQPFISSMTRIAWSRPRSRVMSEGELIEAERIERLEDNRIMGGAGHRS